MNKGSTKKVILNALSILLASSAAFAASDIPLRNWKVPFSGELGKATHIVGRSAIFAPIEPCRLEDTRVSSGGPGPITTTRTYDFLGGGGDCSSISSLPTSAVALSLNFTIVNPLGPGFLYAYPDGGTPPPVSILNYNTGELKSNAAIVPVNASTGAFVVGVGVSGTDVIIDINGIFYNNLVNDDQLSIFSSAPALAAILGQNSDATAGTHGIGGFVTGAGRVYGVQGQISNAATATSAGVRGIATITTNPNIVYGGDFVTNSGVNGSAGLLANSNSASGEVYGLLGDNDSVTNKSAGVWGRSGSNTLPNISGTWGIAGSSYDSTNTFNIGVMGAGQGGVALGVYGTRLVGNVSQTAGVLGFTGTSGVHSYDDITAAGVKSFVEPHPTDPDLEIAFISLEGNEAGTYFRGKAKFQNGFARIAVPEDFRIVSENEGLSIQVTPIGEMATVAVMRINLNEILVKGSRNVEFFYTVNGVRKGRTDFHSIRKNAYFKPGSASDKMSDWNARVRSLLIQNGILTPEGLPNMETAERLGWKAAWEKEAAGAGLKSKTIKTDDPD